MLNNTNLTINFQLKFNKIMKKFLAFIIVCFIFINISFSQDTTNFFKSTKFVFSPRLKYGFIMPHYETFRFFIKGHVKSVELNIGIKQNGKKLWQSIYNHPDVGVGFYFANLGNNEVLGNAKSVYGYFNTKMLEYKRLKLNLNLAIGISYLNKVFDMKTNYLNMALSSKLNVFFCGGFESKFRLTSKYYLVSGFDLTHYSNGAIKMPNKGINVISYRFGVDYIFNEKVKEEFIVKEKYKKNYDFFANYSFGIRRTYPVSDNTIYLISVLSTDFGINTNYKSRFGIGIDVINNMASVKLFEESGIYNSSFTDYFQGGVHFSYDLKLGKTSIYINQGYYFYSKIPKSVKIYERVGLKYKLNKLVYLNLSLNTYFVRAEWIEWGIGIYL